MLFQSLENPSKNLDYLQNLWPSTWFITHLFAFHCIMNLPSTTVLCTTSAGTCARPREVIPFLPQSMNYIHCCFLFSTQLLKYIMIIYTVRTTNLHHPACHILCSLLSPHSYHLSVPSGIHSSYQWYGASASSSVKSRSRWEGWCWKDSRQGE